MRNYIRCAMKRTMKSAYRDEILEHYREPLNYGKLLSCTVSSKQTNPFCGDEIEIYVKFDKNSLGVLANPPPRWTWAIQEIAFTGKGCAISIAGASMLTEYAKGKTKKELTKFSQEDMLRLLGIEVSETRKKCALLGWSILQDCLSNN